jgi:hypothetical protein
MCMVLQLQIARWPQHKARSLVTGPSLVQTIISTSSSSILNYRLTLILKAGNEQDIGGYKGEEKDNEANDQASTLMTY